MEKIIKNFKEWSKTDSNLNENIQFLTDHDKIGQILEDLEVENYSIRSDGTVDIDGGIDFYEYDFEYFPIKFGIVKGYFGCSWCDNLKSLEGAPEECKEFECSNCNSLESLKGAPKKCEEFECCECENLETLKGAPEKCKNFNCSYCENLEYSFKYFPKCKEINVGSTCFEELYNTISDDIFIRLVNTDSKSEFEIILAFGHSKGLNFERYIKPLLKDKTMTEEAFKHKYRSAVAGERFRF